MLVRVYRFGHTSENNFDIREWDSKRVECCEMIFFIDEESDSAIFDVYMGF